MAAIPTDASKLTLADILRYGRYGVRAIPLALNTMNLINSIKTTKQIPDNDLKQVVISVMGFIEGFEVKIPDPAELPIADLTDSVANIIFKAAVQDQSPTHDDMIKLGTDVIDVLQGFGVKISEEVEKTIVNVSTELYDTILTAIKSGAPTEQNINDLVQAVMDMFESLTGTDVPDEMEGEIVKSIASVVESAIIVIGSVKK